MLRYFRSRALVRLQLVGSLPDANRVQDQISPALHSSCRAAYQTEDKQQHYRPDERDENGAAHPADGRRDAQCAEQPTANEGTDDADNDVTDDAVAGATHHQRCENSGHQPNDDPGEYTHCVSPRKRVCQPYDSAQVRVPTLRRITKEERSDESAPLFGGPALFRR